MPLLAVTGAPSFERMCQLYRARPLIRLALRKGSMADAKPIIENLGSRKRVMGCGRRVGEAPNIGNEPDRGSASGE
jgi:hypothetical protein